MPDNAQQPPARSALTLRLVLAAFGLITCGTAAIAFAALKLPPFLIGLAVLFAVIAIVDLAIIITRKHHGTPG
jgi:hypothetical protein